MTGLFADSRVVAFDGYSVIAGGWINKYYVQIGWQLACSCAILSYTFVVSYLIIFVIDHIPGLHVRISEESEILGVDEADVRTLFCYLHQGHSLIYVHPFHTAW